jgi:hypothetical protein
MKSSVQSITIPPNFPRSLGGLPTTAYVQIKIPGAGGNAVQAAPHANVTVSMTAATGETVASTWQLVKIEARSNAPGEPRRARWTPNSKPQLFITSHDKPVAPLATALLLAWGSRHIALLWDMCTELCNQMIQASGDNSERVHIGVIKWIEQ